MLKSFFAAIFPWKWETLAAFTSLLSLTTLACLLAMYDNHMVFAWHGVTLNTYVSILSTVSKVTLVYLLGEATAQWKWVLYANGPRPLLDIERVDAASRGPWGSTLLFLSGKKMSFLRLGALATLLALALDPFAQQLVQTEPRLADSSFWTPKMARADRFSGGIGEGTFVQTETPDEVDNRMKIAILDGLGFESCTSGIGYPTKYSCPTGNCTWDPFESLAVCSSCNDLRGHLTRHNNYPALLKTLGVRLDGEALDSVTTFRTENKLVINNVDNASYDLGGSLTHWPGVIYMTTYSTGNPSETASFKNNDLLIWSTTILRMQRQRTPGIGWPDLPIEAVECALYYCIRRYNARVRNAVLSENSSVVADTRRSAASWQILPGFNDIRNDGYFSNGTEDPNSLVFDKTMAGLHRSDLMLESNGSKYNVSREGVYGISAIFQKAFGSPVYTKTPNVTGVLNGWILTADGRVQYSKSVTPWLWLCPNISISFDVLARSMSNAIRAGSYSTSAHEGIAQVVVTYYFIQWGWITLHTAVVLMGLTFLAITMWKTVSLKAPAWKSHSLPPLAFSHQVGNLFSDTRSVSIMEHRAARLYVSFTANRRDSPSISLNDLAPSTVHQARHS